MDNHLIPYESNDKNQAYLKIREFRENVVKLCVKIHKVDKQ
jgi:hypothetical protein